MKKGSNKKHRIITLLTVTVFIVAVGAIWVLIVPFIVAGLPRGGAGGCADYGYEWHLESKTCTSDLTDRETVKRLKYINSD